MYLCLGMIPATWKVRSIQPLLDLDMYGYMDIYLYLYLCVYHADGNITGMRSLVEGRIRELKTEASKDMFGTQFQVLLKQIRNYLDGLLCSVGMVVHQGVYSQGREFEEVK